MQTNLLDRVTINPDICNGKPIIRGMRITVETVLEFLSNGDTINEILEAYPFLEKEDIQASIAFALKNLATTKNDIPVAS